MSRAVTTFIVMVAGLGIGLLVAVAVLDPLRTVALTYDLGGMSSQVKNIHVTLVKYMAPLFVGVALLYAVFRILSKERQQL